VDYPPHLVPRLKKESAYTSTPRLGLHGVFWYELYLYLDGKSCPDAAAGATPIFAQIN
jgi:hypothetical protein